MPISRDEVLMSRDKQYPLSDALEVNLAKLLVALNKFREAYGHPMTVTSGYRPAAINAATPGAASHSNHVVCLACDFHDPDGALDQWCLDRPDVLEMAGLWQESPASTPGWCHLQAVPPRSGLRVFKP